MAYAADDIGPESVTAVVNNALVAANLPIIADLTLPPECDSPNFRGVLGRTAKNKGWFKDISRGEKLAGIIGPHLDAIAATPLAQTIVAIRGWVDG